MQDQKLTTINFQAGIVTEQSPKVAESFWVSSDKIRFRLGKPELLGGWQQTTTPEFLAEVYGVPRALETVRTLEGQRAALIGTNIGVYSTDLESYTNVTPVVTAVNATNIFSTSIGSTEIVVSISAHGLTLNSLVAFTSTTTTIGGNIIVAPTTAVYQVSNVLTNSFSIIVDTTAAATSASTGGNVTALLYYPAGLQNSDAFSGWGTGVWSGNFGWSTSPPVGASFAARQWSFDHWGTNIMAVPTSGPLFYWDANNSPATPLVIVTAAPSINQIVRVESEARHVILYGTHDVDGQYDPLLIRWSNRESFTEWAPTEVNRAGDFRLNAKGSQIRNVTRVGSQYLILTDAEAFTQNFIGGNDVFGFLPAGRGCGAISQNAAVEYGGITYWMSNTRQFFAYNGRVEPLSCSVLRFIFDNLNPLYADKVVAGSNAQFDEVIWFYPSLESTGENDSYVIYNVREQHWSPGRLARTVWKDRSTFTTPLAAGVEGEGLFYHEVGYEDNGQPLIAHLQSGYFDLVDGNDILFINKIVPDIIQPDGQPIVGSVEFYLRSRKYPGASTILKGPYQVSAATDKISTRLRGREVSFEIRSSCACGSPWRLGEVRLALQPDGLR
jgi:hypothetical protein